MTLTDRLRLLRERGGLAAEYPNNRAGRRAQERAARKHRKASK